MSFFVLIEASGETCTGCVFLVRDESGLIPYHCRLLAQNLRRMPGPLERGAPERHPECLTLETRSNAELETRMRIAATRTPPPFGTL